MNIEPWVTEKDLHDLVLSILQSREERRLALRSATIDIDAVLEELNHALHISAGNCKEECVLSVLFAAKSSGALFA